MTLNGFWKLEHCLLQPLVGFFAISWFQLVLIFVCSVFGDWMGCNCRGSLLKIDHLFVLDLEDLQSLIGIDSYQESS